jgi:hypothetical protein
MPDTTAGAACEAFAYLPLRMRIAILGAHPSADWELMVGYLSCALAPHSGDEHHAVAYDHFPGPGSGALWTTWRTGAPPRTFALRPDCPTRSDDDTACALFTTHPGPHSWEPEGHTGP